MLLIIYFQFNVVNNYHKREEIFRCVFHLLSNFHSSDNAL